MQCRRLQETGVLAALVALAAALRGLAWTRTAAIFDDGPVFLALAQAAAHADAATLLDHPYHPGYPLAVAAAAKLLGSAGAAGLEQAAAAVSIACGALAVGLLYALVRDAFDRRTARVAALLLAIHPTAVAFSADVQSEGLYLALFLLCAWLCWRALRDARSALALAAGLAAGLAYTVRPEGLGLAAVGLAGGAWLGLRGAWGRAAAARWCAALLAGVLIGAAPYAAALHAHSGQWMLTQKKSALAVAALGAAGPAGPVRAVGAIPGGGPLPGAPALAPEPTGARLERAAAQLYQAFAGSLRLELAGLLLLGVVAARGRPGRRALFFGTAAAFYAAVLFALGSSAGYVSARHALPPIVLLFGYVARGVETLGGWITGHLAALGAPGGWWRRRLGAPSAGAVLGCVLLAAVFVPRDLAPRRLERLAERRAAQWLAAHGASGQPVAARRMRAAYYARARFVPLPIRPPGLAAGPRAGMPAAGDAAEADPGLRAMALLRYLRARDARFVVIEAHRMGDHAGLEEARAAGLLRPIHRERAAGREALVLEDAGAR